MNVLTDQPTLEAIDLDLIEVMMDLDPGMLMWSATEDHGSAGDALTRPAGRSRS